MSATSQQRASKVYREGLARRGMTRFEVMAAPCDKALIRDLARRLSEAGPAADRLRADVASAVAGPPPSKGCILAALLRSPLADLDLASERTSDDERALRL